MNIVDPTSHPNWNDQINASHPGDIFKTSNWVRVLQKSYGYTPCFFPIEGSNTHLAMMEIRSWLTGVRGVSLPFSDFIPGDFTPTQFFDDLQQQVISYGKSRGWKTIEWRTPNLAREEQAGDFYLHLLTLYPDTTSLRSGLSSNHKRNIKKAQKAGVSVAIVNTHSGMDRFYRLNVLTRKRHGLPPQPRRFFNAIYTEMIEQGLGNIAIATLDGRDLAANIYLHFKNQVMYKYGAADLSGPNVGVTTLLMWNMICHYAEAGYAHLDFGRTDLPHEGLRRFKKAWGTEETRQGYLKMDLRTDTKIPQEASKVEGHHTVIFRRTPTPVLEWIGQLLYPHMG